MNKKNHYLYICLGVFFILNLVLLVSISNLKSKLENESSIHQKDSIASYQIKFDMVSYDFATIQEGEEAKVIFAFTNKTNKPLKILNIETDCGCTKAVWNDKEIEAGQKGFVELGYDTRLKGVFEKQARVFIKGENKPINLTISGNVITM